MDRVANFRAWCALWSLSVLALSAGCRSSGPGSSGPPPVEMHGSNWSLVSLYLEPVEPDTRITLTLGADGRASGSSGVNRFTGPFEMKASSAATGKISFGDMAVTKMAGAEEAMRQEQRFLEALRAANVYRAEGGLMELTNNGQPLLRFRKVAAEQVRER